MRTMRLAVAIVLMAAVSFLAPARTAEAQVNTALSASDVQTVLLGNKQGDGPWWGAGIDFRAAGCNSLELCTAAQALQFNNNTGRVGVKIFDSVSDDDSHKAYLAYLQGQRYPRDNHRHYRGQQWVKWSSDGTFSWANNHVQWNNCRVVSQKLFTCDWLNTKNNAKNTVRFHLLAKGDPPTAWPATSASR